jgi:hypothetical protein
MELEYGTELETISGRTIVRSHGSGAGASTARRRAPRVRVPAQQGS